MNNRIDDRALGRHGRPPRPDRIVMLRASRSRRLLDRVAALPPRVTTALNTVAFLSLAAALLVLMLV
jgi:hypothetical protein